MKILKTFAVTLAFLGLSVSAAMSQTYVITAAGSLFNAHKGGTAITTNQPVQAVIDAIKADAAGANCTIQFGDGGVLDLGGGSTSLIQFDGSGTPTWGLITLTGKATTACTSVSGVIRLENGVSLESKAEIAATTLSGILINNRSTGTLNISGGALSANGGIAVANTSTGNVNISSGTVSATDGIAVANAATGKITVSGDALITSQNIDLFDGGTILIADDGTATAVRLEITGGTVENTVCAAINNKSKGAIDISGGTVSAIRYAVYSATTSAPGAINISGGTVSAATNEAAVVSLGEINISGGTVQATGESGTAVQVFAGGKANISGGTVSAPGYEGVAVGITSTGKTTISGTAFVTSGNIEAPGGTIVLGNYSTGTGVRLEITGGTIENTSAEDQGAVAIHNASTGAIGISGGTVSVTDNYGYAVYNASTGAIDVSGGTVSTSGEEGSAIYNLSTGAVNISNGTVQATGNFGFALYNLSTGAIDISGGTVQETGISGTAIDNYGAGAVNISGGRILAKDYYAIKNINGGTVSIGSGIVFAYGTAETDVINGAANTPVSHNSVIAAWDETAGKTTYEESTSEDIYKLPATATAVWANEAGIGGISVVNGTNTGFIPLAEVTVITAGIVETFTVTFAGEEISGIPTQTVEHGNYTTEPAPAPERTGYDFGGWFTDNSTFLNKWNFDTDAVTQDITLYARWDIQSGIKEVERTYIKIYPNPTRDILHFSLAVTFELIDQQGKVLLKSDKAVESVNVSGLPSGIYLVRIATDTGYRVMKVIKE